MANFVQENGGNPLAYDNYDSDLGHHYPCPNNFPIFTSEELDAEPPLWNKQDQRDTSGSDLVGQYLRPNDLPSLMANPDSGAPENWCQRIQGQNPPGTSHANPVDTAAEQDQDQIKKKKELKNSKEAERKRNDRKDIHELEVRISRVKKANESLEKEDNCIQQQVQLQDNEIKNLKSDIVELQDRSDEQSTEIKELVGLIRKKPLNDTAIGVYQYANLHDNVLQLTQVKESLEEELENRDVIIDALYAKMKNSSRRGTSRISYASNPSNPVAAPEADKRGQEVESKRNGKKGKRELKGEMGLVKENNERLMRQVSSKKQKLQSQDKEIEKLQSTMAELKDKCDKQSMLVKALTGKVIGKKPFNDTAIAVDQNTNLHDKVSQLKEIKETLEEELMTKFVIIGALCAMIRNSAASRSKMRDE